MPDINPNILANGTHSLIGMRKKIIINGVAIPAPPIPPAVPITLMIKITIFPIILSAEGGHSS
jgi:hypothetical protein